MSKLELLAKYTKDIEKLKKIAKKHNICETEVDDVFFKCFKRLKKEDCEKKNKYSILKSIKFLAKCSVISFVILIIIYVVIYNHQPTRSLILQNIQWLIYPGLRLLRLLAVPVISTFPSLTGYYDETCLLSNPYFRIFDMECWPCENVFTVINITGFNNISLYQTGIPYIIKTDQPLVTMPKLQHFYKTYKQIFDNDASQIMSTNSEHKQISDLGNIDFNDIDQETHIIWRILRMEPARLIRKLFPRPRFISQQRGQSPERFIIMDGIFTEPYSFPDPECGFVYAIQGSGERTIILKPSKDCIGSCRPLSVNLKSSNVLYYNWWYWRPISIPTTNSTTASITYIISFC